MSLYSEVISTRPVHKGDVVGYTTYKVEEDGYILTLPVGYADGVTKEYRYVYINDEYKKIVSDCMDMILVFSKNNIPVGTKVEIFGNHIKIKTLCSFLKTNAYHLFNQISNRVLRIHIKDEEKEEIFY